MMLAKVVVVEGLKPEGVGDVRNDSTLVAFSISSLNASQ
jgi:hypothetical protein